MKGYKDFSRGIMKIVGDWDNRIIRDNKMFIPVTDEIEDKYVKKINKEYKDKYSFKFFINEDAPYNTLSITRLII